MAKKTFIQLTDDLDDKVMEDGEGETVTFAYRGTSYEIDLSHKNIAAFDKAISKYIGAARKVPARGTRTGARRGQTRAVDDVDMSAVRAWAEKNDIEVGPRGRIRREIIDQYRAAGN